MGEGGGGGRRRRRRRRVNVLQPNIPTAYLDKDDVVVELNVNVSFASGLLVSLILLTISIAMKPKLASYVIVVVACIVGSLVIFGGVIVFAVYVWMMVNKECLRYKWWWPPFVIDHHSECSAGCEPMLEFFLLNYWLQIAWVFTLDVMLILAFVCACRPDLRGRNKFPTAVGKQRTL